MSIPLLVCILLAYVLDLGQAHSSCEGFRSLSMEVLNGRMHLNKSYLETQKSLKKDREARANCEQITCFM